MTVIELAPLDQLSTSQTFSHEWITADEVSHEQWLDIHVQIEEAEAAKDELCTRGAPYIFYVDGSDRAHLVQGCCNSWSCPRCGLLRALHEYGRMVQGARELAAMGESLFFLTLTCRGRDLDLETADREYMTWTNRLLTAARAKNKRAKIAWFYAQVTERQQRGAPHSHLIITFCPDDVIEYATGAPVPNGVTARHDTLYSPWLTGACVRAGLGPMVDLSAINNPVAVAVYAAKYMFKDAMTTEWPKGWRRVRYSQSWPKLPDRKPSEAFPLVRLADWRRMEATGRTVWADSNMTLEAAYARAITCVVYRVERRH